MIESVSAALSEGILHKRKCVLYCDVDGTLVGGENRLSPHVLEEIRAFVAAGFDFTLATGRNLQGVQRLLPHLPITAPLVLCNGAYVYNPDIQTAVHTAVPPDVVRYMVPKLLKIPNATLYIDTAELDFWVSREDVFSDPYVLLEGLRPRVFTDVEQVLAYNEVIKIGIKVHGFGADVSHVKRVVEEAGDVYAKEIRACLSSHNYIEIMGAGVSKWFGIQVSQGMQLDKADVIFAVGDHHNDLEMIQNATVGIAMGNAVSEVKESADYCIGRVEDMALGNFLKFLRSSETFQLGVY